MTLRTKPNAPDRIYGWLNGHLSIARHYGGCTLNGHSYLIDEKDADRPLVRSDVLQAEKMALRAASRASKQAAKAAQGGLL